MKKKFLIILIIAAVIFIYLNRSYAYIYDKIHQANLKSPDVNQTYSIGDNMSPQKIVYVALGDSLTAGVGTDNYDQSYPYLVAQALSRDGDKVILKNRSFLGLKTDDLQTKVLPQAISDKPNIVTLLIGVNDTRDFVSKSDFQKNYDIILQKLVQETNVKIYVISIPFIGANTLMLPPYNYYFDYQTKEFNKIIKGLADKYGVNYIDLYTPTVNEFKKSGPHYSKDLFHPSAHGYAVWAQIIYDNINK